MNKKEPKTGADVDDKIAAAIDTAKVPEPPKEKSKPKICGRCGAPMKKNLEKNIWECTKCAYDEAF